MSIFGPLKPDVNPAVANAPNPSAFYRAIYDEAHAAGMAAGAAVTPTPMYVTGMDGSIFPPVMDGVCGFAWIRIKGTSAFAKWATKEKLVSPAYPTGKHFWVGEFNQSLTRKEAYADAFALVLGKYGIWAVSGSRMD